jgi:polysaccharide export outer membrane protein
MDTENRTERNVDQVLKVLSNGEPMMRALSISRMLLIILSLALVSVQAACATEPIPGSPFPTQQTAQTTPPDNAPPPAGSAAPGNSMIAGYLIGKGDIIEVNVWKEPMLSGETFVRTDGMVSLPLLGDVKAEGRTPMELREEIKSKLEEYVESPTVTVILKGPVSQKYYLAGEVSKPGEYDLTKDLSFLQAMARAGGFTEWADKNDILLIRMENGVENRIRINYKDIVKGKGENIHIKANDTIIVP